MLLIERGTLGALAEQFLVTARKIKDPRGLSPFLPIDRMVPTAEQVVLGALTIMTGEVIAISDTVHLRLEDDGEHKIIEAGPQNIPTGAAA